MSEQQQNIAVEELLAVLIASQNNRVEIPKPYFHVDTIKGKVIAVDSNENSIVLSLVDAEDMDIEGEETDDNSAG